VTLPYYQDDAVTLYHGDCREVMADLPRTCDVLMTDPPYASAAATVTTGRAKAKWGGNWGDMSLVAFMVEATLTGAPLIEGHEVYWFTDHLGYAATVPVMFRRYPSVQSIVWDKDALGMGARYRKQTEFIVYAWTQQAPEFASKSARDLIRLRPTFDGGKVHSAQKPVELMAELLRPSAGTCVLDPYAGSGTTLLAARQLGRKAVGVEIEERYCEIAATRLASRDLFDGVA